MPDQIVLLGTKGGPALRNHHHMPSSSLLEVAGKVMVIDCGLGVTRSIVKAGYALLDIDAVFITHLHSDHLLELGPLLHTMWTTGLKRTIPVYGPVGTRQYFEHFLKSMSFDNDIRVLDEGRPALSCLFEINEYAQGQVTILDEITVEALRVVHPPVDECYALKFLTSNKVVVFSSDTAFFPPLAKFSQDADILVHEAMLSDGIESLLKRTPNAEKLEQHLNNSHSTAAEAAQIAKTANVSHLILNHLIPADDPDFTPEAFYTEVQTAFDGKITIGEDGMVIAIY